MQNRHRIVQSFLLLAVSAVLLGGLVLTLFLSEPYPAAIQPFFDDTWTKGQRIESREAVVSVLTAEGAKITVPIEKLLPFSPAGWGPQLAGRLAVLNETEPPAKPAKGWYRRFRKWLKKDYEARIRTRQRGQIAALREYLRQRVYLLTGAEAVSMVIDLSVRELAPLSGKVTERPGGTLTLNLLPDE